MVRFVWILFLWMFISFGSCSIENIRPIANLNGQALSGRWYQYNLRPEDGFDSDNLQLSHVWDVSYNGPLDTYYVVVSGRSIKHPYRCDRSPSVVSPTSRHQIYSLVADNGRIRRETSAALTDYTSYFVIVDCIPRFQPGCRFIVDVRTREQFAGPRLRRFLDNMIVKRLGLNLNEFYDIQGMSRHLPGC